MKTTQQIAKDCGLDEAQTMILEVELKVTAPNEFRSEIIGALYRRIEMLEAWKEEAISVTPPLQEIAVALGLPLGVSIHDKILPGIESLKLRLGRLTKALERIATHKPAEEAFMAGRALLPEKEGA